MIARTGLLVLVAGTLGLGACRKEEQNRPTAFKPGVYLGETTPALTKDQVTELQKRGNLLK